MVQPAQDGRPLPWPTAITRPFFDAARERRLLLPRCPRDGWFFYPRSHCPRCLGTDWSWQQVSGRGTVHAFTVDRLGHTPGLAALAPDVIAIVELEEGPRMTARLAGCEPGDIHVGLPVHVDFEDVDGTSLAVFRPDGGGERRA
jgi:hypothetical protein